MRQLRTLLFTVVCVAGAVLGMTGSTYSEPSGTGRPAGVTGSAAADTARPLAPSPGPVTHPVGAEVSAGRVDGEPAAAEQPRMHRAPMVATAVRHVPTPSQPASNGELDPITNDAMVLLIGWTMLVLLGGGALAGLRRD